MNKASSAHPCLNRTPLHRLSKEDLFWSVWNVLRATIPEQHRRKQSTYWERKSETKRNACLPPCGHSYCPQQRHINSFLKADFLMLTKTTTNRGTATFWEVTFWLVPEVLWRAALMSPAWHVILYEWLSYSDGSLPEGKWWQRLQTRYGPCPWVTGQALC